jgi:hypothetical protein
MNKFRASSSCLLLLLSVIVGIFIIGFNNQVTSANAQRVFQTYENDMYGIKIKYPPNWEIDGYNIGTTETGASVVELSPLGKVNPSLESEPVIKLVVFFLSPENATLQSFTDQKLKDIQTGQTIKILSQNSSATLGGYPAHKVVYEITSSYPEKQFFKGMDIWTILETEAYVLEFFGVDRNEYDQYIKTAEKIINSFQFTR